MIVVDASVIVSNYLENEKLRLFSNFIFIPIDESISDLSVEIASNYFLKGADAVYVAVAYKYDVPLATFDEEQKKKASKIIKVMNIS
jgi:predicted nucleic acid-binding protein